MAVEQLNQLAVDRPTDQDNASHPHHTTCRPVGVGCSTCSALGLSVGVGCYALVPFTLNWLAGPRGQPAGLVWGATPTATWEWSDSERISERFVIEPQHVVAKHKLRERFGSPAISTRCCGIDKIWVHGAGPIVSDELIITNSLVVTTELV